MLQLIVYRMVKVSTPTIGISEIVNKKIFDDSLEQFLRNSPSVTTDICK